MRFATKGPAVMPMKILTDDAWLDALTRVVEKGRKLHKDVVLHTHFNNPAEITGITEAAMGRLFERGIVVRNQSGAHPRRERQRRDDDAAREAPRPRQRAPVLRLRARHGAGRRGPAHQRRHRASTSRSTCAAATAGFNTPTFVVDAPGGGGKRDAHSYEYYDRDTGISVYAAPSVKPGQLFMYFDPLHQLGTHQQRRWKSVTEQQAMIDDALRKARGRVR